VDPVKLCGASQLAVTLALGLGVVGLVVAVACGQVAEEPEAPDAPAAELGAGAKTDSSPGAEGPPDVGATRPARLPPRDMLTPEEYRDLAAKLREAYSKPTAEWPAATLDPGVDAKELGRRPPVPFPPDNPFTKEKALLGRSLFFDPRLSGSGQIACASCHDPDLGWADGRTVAFGHDRQPLKRNAPALTNAAFNAPYFWDGRAPTLEAQVLEPIAAPSEMAGTGEDVVTRLSAVPDYRKMFASAFGSEEVTMPRVAQAVATFERTLVAGRSRFDIFLAGRKDALSDEAVRGLHLFRTDARCMNCHHGPNFTDGQFHDLGLSFYGRTLQDLGRHEVTKRPEDVGRFKTPSLRNVGRTAPYMHNGLFELQGVLNLYNAGMPTLRRRPEQKDDPLFPSKSPLLKPLGLNRQDLADLKAFMESLTEPRSRIRPKVPPGAPPAPAE
jgi:cytochrome c peroxidase